MSEAVARLLAPIALALTPVLLGGCLANRWLTGTAALVNEQQVALALGDDAAENVAFDPASLPEIAPPTRVRPCCAFGMDLPMSLAGKRVPGYKVSNVLSASDVGHHEYDNGMMTLNQDLARVATLEGNGLVYTCRGGFVDTAHVRDNADLTLFLAMKIVAALPGPAIVSLQSDGAVKRVVVKAIPADVIERLGRWEVAITLAQWASFQLSIWHEIVTWYGYESISGFSEKVSAFSPEDLYSNALGAKIAGGILRNQRVRARAEWNTLVDAWMTRSLQRLVPLPRDLGRRAMKSLDGRWWDSQKNLPDWTLVRRRNFDLSSLVFPWRLPDAELPADPVLTTACARGPAALPLEIPERLGQLALKDLILIDFEVGGWAPVDFPFADPGQRRVTSAELPRLTEVVRSEAQATLGAGFDHPAGRKRTLPSQ